MPRPAKDENAPEMKRVQMDLAPSALARLQGLQTRLEASSYSETIRRAMWIHETLLDLADGGGRIYVERDGERHEVRIEGLSA